MPPLTLNDFEIRPMRLSELDPAPYNPRVMYPEDEERLTKSIKAFGLVEPIVWNEKTKHVVGGNMRLRILLQEGVQTTDVLVVKLDLQEEQLLNLALNKIHGAWDTTALIRLLKELNEAGFDMSLTGFPEYELRPLLGSREAGEVNAEGKHQIKAHEYTCPNCHKTFTK